MRCTLALPTSPTCRRRKPTPDTANAAPTSISTLQKGATLFGSLLEDADIFSQSYRARSLARRGLSPEALAERCPGIIYISENAYGQFGPWQEKRGFDGNVQAASGIHHVQQKDMTSMMGVGPAIALNDYGTGYWGAYGALEALRRVAPLKEAAGTSGSHSARRPPGSSDWGRLTGYRTPIPTRDGVSPPSTAKMSTRTTGR